MTCFSNTCRAHSPGKSGSVLGRNTHTHISGLIWTCFKRQNGGGGGYKTLGYVYKANKRKPLNLRWCKRNWKSYRPSNKTNIVYLPPTIFFMKIDAAYSSIFLQLSFNGTGLKVSLWMFFHSWVPFLFREIERICQITIWIKVQFKKTRCISRMRLIFSKRPLSFKPLWCHRMLPGIFMWALDN